MGCVCYCTDEFAAEKKMIGRGRKFGARIVYEEGATDTRWGERKTKKRCGRANGCYILNK
jgi:hypothetical protein